MSKGYDIAGMFVCSHCNQSVNGLTHISYKLEEEFVEDWIMLHEKCLKPYRLAKKGLIHKCPKCSTRGYTSSDTLNLWTKLDGSMEVVWSSQMYHKPGRYNSGKFESLKEKTKPCDLCDGEGYLAKEPIPVITEWRKAP